MTQRVDNKIREAYQKIDYTPTKSEFTQLMADNDKLRLALGEAVSQIQQLQAQLDYTRALHDNLNQKVDYAGNPMKHDIEIS